MVRYIYPADHNLSVILKIDKIFEGKLDFKEIKLKEELYQHYYFWYENKENCPIYVSKNTFKRYFHLLYIEEEDKEHYVFIKEFDVFIFDYTLPWWTQHFCCYCLQAFSTADTLKIHVNDCFKINSKQMIKMPKRAKYVRLQNCKRKIK